MSLIRLQKALANATMYSRRKAEDLIVKGRVSVNGRVVAELGAKVDPDRDEVAVDGTVIPRGENKVYFLLYKPRGVVSTTDDPQSRPTVTSLLQDVKERVYPVGRLDLDSEGLLLLTNDGDLALKVMHPRYGMKKTYLVLVKTVPTSQQLEHLRKGVTLEEGETRPAQVEVEEDSGEKGVGEVRHRRRKKEAGPPDVRSRWAERASFEAGGLGRPDTERPQAGVLQASQAFRGGATEESGSGKDYIGAVTLRETGRTFKKHMEPEFEKRPQNPG